MKGLHKFLDEKIAPPFKEGGKLRKFWPMYDALETFAFVPGHTTHKGAHVRDGIDLKRTMFLVIVALIPCLLFGIYNIGFQYDAILTEAGRIDWLGEARHATWLEMFIYGAPLVLPMVIVSYAVGLGIEILFGIINGHSINEGFLVSGMLIPLVMPVDCPLWMVAVGTAFAVVIAKEVFGGTGMNILNVALTARAFMFFAYPTKMSGNNVWFHTGYSDSLAAAASPNVIDTYTGATPLGLLVDTPDGSTISSVIANVGGGFDFSLWNSFMGFIPGSIGSTSVLMCLIGAAILIATGIGSWRIMAWAVVGGALMGGFFNYLGSLEAFADNLYLDIPWYHQLCLGGFAFGVVFMATDPVSAAQTTRGKMWYGLLIGILAILIRTANPAYPEGIMLAILFMNVMAPTIDHYVIEGNIKKRMKRAKLAIA
ncbi:MAG: NADH:ubiquinone reductase (Na(+)-transporting) subunit B [Flavobacteriales bacterium]|jgi:Na+-transporting NADH:ubiquinone oxidoreductase subunit B|tara:strand:- start:1004 stop:2281 length:1278 start_codon:yes stop_codon:yes gene_type:complete